jgi:replicative DNA helicase
LGNNLFNSDIEESVLSCVLQDGNSYKLVKDYLTSNDFWWKPYSVLFECFDALHQKGLNIDFITVQDELSRRGWFDNFITANDGIKCQDAINFIAKKNDVTVGNAESYALKLLDDSSKRKIISIAGKVPDWINSGIETNTVLSNIETELSKIAVYSGVKSNLIKNTPEVLDNVLREIENNAGQKNYIQTGLKDLDRLIGGLFGGQLILVAGRAGEGKSSALLTFLMHIVLDKETKRKAGLFTLEMDNEEYMNRMIAWVSGISSLRIKMGKIRDDEKENFKESAKLIRDNASVLWDDSVSPSIPQLRTKIRRMKDSGADIIFIDQLNLIRSLVSYDQEHVKINNLGYDLKSLCREFDLPIIVAHQMNRAIESTGRAKDKDPKSSDLSQAGEGPSDLVMFITHKKDEGVIQSSKFWIVKNRNGPTGSIPVKFIGESTRFEDADPVEQPFEEK